VGVGPHGAPGVPLRERRDRVARRATRDRAGPSPATPADWKDGQDVIIGTSVSDEDAHKKFPGFDAKKPYLRVVPQPGK